MENSEIKIKALLGPTNTGKTYLAIEEMLKHDSGIFGLPLRLLAREVYDKCVKKVRVNSVVAFVSAPLCETAFAAVPLALIA